MKKRLRGLLALCLALCMALGMMTTGVSAAVEGIRYNNDATGNNMPDPGSIVNKDDTLANMNSGGLTLYYVAADSETHDDAADTNSVTIGDPKLVFSSTDYLGYKPDPAYDGKWIVAEATDGKDGGMDIVTLRMVLLPNTYTIKFDAGGGTGTMADQAMTYDVPKPLSQNTFKNGEGYAFNGWLGEDGKSYSDGQTVSKLTTVDGDVFTMTAQWRPASYSIVYDANGGTGSMATQDMTYGTAADLNDNEFVRDGYIFDDWKGSDGQWYYDGQEVKNLTSVDNGVFTMTASWKPIAYKIAYDANGGTGSMADQSMTYDVSQELTANAFVRDGYSFDGWKDKANNTYTDKQNVNNLTTVDGDIVELKAQWKSVEYTINYNDPDKPDGENPVHKQEVTVEDTDEKFYDNSDKKFPEEHYDLIGWDADSDGEPDYKPGDPITPDILTGTDDKVIDLEPVYDAHSFVIKYYDSDGETEFAEISPHEFDTDDAKGTDGILINDGSGLTKPGYVEIEKWIHRDGDTVHEFVPGEKITDEILDHLAGHDGEMTLIAQWEPIEYTINYNDPDKPDEENPVHKQEVTVEDLDETFYDDPDNKFPKDHYDLIGWDADADGEPDYEPGQTITPDILTGTDEQIIDLVPVYDANSFTIKYYDSDGKTEYIEISPHEFDSDDVNGPDGVLIDDGSGLTKPGHIEIEKWIHKDGKTVYEFVPGERITNEILDHLAGHNGEMILIAQWKPEPPIKDKDKGEAEKDGSSSTGDDSNMTPWMILALAAASGAAAVTFRKKTEE